MWDLWDGGVSGYNPPWEKAATSRATDAPLFLQRLFKGQIDRLGRGGMGSSESLEVERWVKSRQMHLLSSRVNEHRVN